MQQRAPRSMAKRLRSFDIFPKVQNRNAPPNTPLPINHQKNRWTQQINFVAVGGRRARASFSWCCWYVPGVFFFFFKPNKYMVALPFVVVVVVGGVQ